MSIRSLSETAAVAKLNSLEFVTSIEEVAQKLAEWQSQNASLLVPISIPFPTETHILDSCEQPTKLFEARAKWARIEIAKRLEIDVEASNKLSFTMTNKEVWFLGPRPKLDKVSMFAAVQSTPSKFIELMLKKELIEAAAFDPQQTFVIGGFGPSIYLGSTSQAEQRRLHLAEAEFLINSKYKTLICNITTKVFVKKSRSTDSPSSASLLVDAGEGYMMSVTRLVPSDFFELDARKYPMLGISLDTIKIRQTRFYYINVLFEFAQALFSKAGVLTKQNTFVASHCVDNGYIQLESLANLERPLIVINTTTEKIDDETLKPLRRFKEFFPNGFHVSGNKKSHFKPIVVNALDSTFNELNLEMNYLFLNGHGEKEYGTVSIAKKSATPEFKSTKTSLAYDALARGDSIADKYTEIKYSYLMAKNTVSISIQGLDYAPSDLASLQPGKDNSDSRQLQEAVKRCLVEISLKECLLGLKTITPSHPLPAELKTLEVALIATRQIRRNGKPPKQLISVVDAYITSEGISVTKVRRSPWAEDNVAAIDFLLDFPFLQPVGKKLISDKQFWIVDKHTQKRLTVWAGAFVPRIILNNNYSSVEDALGAQEPYLANLRKSGKKGKYYSKGKDFNLLPYYMSMYLSEHQRTRELTGTRIPLQDCGEFLRVFIPPAGGINGPGDSLSGMRDVMLYEEGGKSVNSRLLEQPLVLLYLHTMTNGILVGGDNSKMSILEKLAKLALEN